LASLDAPCLQRAQGRPGAGWHPRSAVRRLREDRCTAAYRAAWTSRPFPAQWFDGLWRALPGERCTIAPVALRTSSARARSGRLTTASLDAQTPGVRTTRFCRTLDHTGRVRAAQPLTGQTRPATAGARCAQRPPRPGPRIVTIAKRPLSLGRDGKRLRHFRISVNRKFELGRNGFSQKRSPRVAQLCRGPHEHPVTPILPNRSRPRSCDRLDHGRTRRSS
jgi:hypothetical protein